MTCRSYLLHQKQRKEKARINNMVELNKYLYYKDSLTRLFLGDCLEVMKNIPDNYVDCVVTDPPYLMAYKTNMRKDKTHKFCSEIVGDRDEQLISNSVLEFNRILKNNSALYVFCNSNKIDIFKNIIQQYFTIKNIIVWIKNNHTAGDLVAQYGKRYEFIIYANKGRRKINGIRIDDVWNFDKVVGKEQIHQNQKPIALLEQIITKSTDEGDIILDAFVGSGTTLVAAKKLNRKSIGIEINKDYCDICIDRLKNIVVKELI